jgi:branched-chain amino acid transport system permease protein
MIILGGLGSLPGAVIGAAAFVLLSDWFQALTKHWQLLLGGFIIAIVPLLPQGIAGGLATLRLKLQRPQRAATPVAVGPQQEPAA